MMSLHKTSHNLCIPERGSMRHQLLEVALGQMHYTGLITDRQMMRERLQYGCRSAHSPGEIHSPGLYVHQAVDQSLPALQCVPLAWTLHLPRVDQPYLSNRICQGTMASCSHPHQHCHGMHPAASNMLQGLLAYTIISARACRAPQACYLGSMLHCSLRSLHMSAVWCVNVAFSVALCAVRTLTAASSMDPPSAGREG